MRSWQTLETLFLRVCLTVATPAFGCGSDDVDADAKDPPHSNPTARDCDGTWAVVLSGPQGTFNERSATGVALYPNGDLALLGGFKTGIDLGGAPLVEAGMGEGFVARFDACGHHRFSMARSHPACQFGATAVLNPVVDLESNLAFIEKRYCSNGAKEEYAASKLDPDGALLWTLSAAPKEGVRLDALVMTPDAGVVLSGTHASGVAFGGVDLPTSSGNWTNSFVARFDKTGAHVFTRSFGSLSESGQVVLKAVRVDSQGRTIVAGNIHYEPAGLDFGGDPLASTGDHELFFAAFAVDGTHLWSKRFGAANVELSLTDVELNHNDELLATGTVGGLGVDFGGGLLEGSSGKDVLLLKLGANGGHRWSRRFATSGQATPTHLVVGAADDVLLVTVTEAAASIDVGDHVVETSAGAIVALFDDSGMPAASGAAPRTWIDDAFVRPSGGFVVLGHTAPTSPAAQPQIGGISLAFDSTVVAWLDERLSGVNAVQLRTPLHRVIVDGQGGVVGAGEIFESFTLSGQAVSPKDGTDALLIRLPP